jgi:hypothetical protein
MAEPNRRKKRKPPDRDEREDCPPAKGGSSLKPTGVKVREAPGHLKGRAEWF